MSDSRVLDTENVLLHPLLGFSAGILDGAVALRLDFATTPDGYGSGEGDFRQFVMTADAAIDIGQALVERGELVRDRGRT